MNNSKIVVIGLDGAPFEVIKDFSDRGIIPNISNLIKEGCFGVFLSSFLPTSPVAWTSIVTGKNPAKHGIFDWAKRKEKTYNIDTVNSTCVKQPTIWEILSKENKTVGIFNIPITYPPKKVNGFLVSGFDTPNTKVYFTYPENLARKIKDKIGDYPLCVKEAYIRGKEENYIKDLKYNIEKKKQTILYLIDNFDLDFYFFVFMELDHLHHKMWRFLREKESFFIDIYKSIDNAVGEIINKFDKNTTFFIISDHGAGPLEGIMYINNFLQQIGLLKLKKSPTLYFKNLLEKMDIFAKVYCLLSKFGLGKLVRSIPKNLQDKIATSFVSFSDIDWLKTKAYSFGEYGQIYINLKGREPNGIVEPGDEYNGLLDFISKELLKLKEPNSGKQIIKEIYRKEELYYGPYLDMAPDLIFSIADFKYDSSVKFGFLNKKIFDKPEFEDSGIHRREGIFIAKGPYIQKNKNTLCINILDIVPTILYMLDLKISKDIDGKVISEIFKEDFVKDRPIRFSDEDLYTEDTSKELTKKELRIIRERLKSLGYLG